MPKVQNNLHISEISSENNGDKVDFLLVDKRKGFLQVEIITLGVHSQACSKYPRLQVCNIIGISPEKRGG